jgi:hypothetical protein
MPRAWPRALGTGKTFCGHAETLARPSIFRKQMSLSSDKSTLPTFRPIAEGPSRGHRKIVIGEGGRTRGNQRCLPQGHRRGAWGNVHLFLHVKVRENWVVSQFAKLNVLLDTNPVRAQRVIFRPESR